jgi:hypothetical protein
MPCQCAPGIHPSPPAKAACAGTDGPPLRAAPGHAAVARQAATSPGHGGGCATALGRTGRSLGRAPGRAGRVQPSRAKAGQLSDPGVPALAGRATRRWPAVRVRVGVQLCSRPVAATGRRWRGGWWGEWQGVLCVSGEKKEGEDDDGGRGCSFVLRRGVCGLDGWARVCVGVTLTLTLSRSPSLHTDRQLHAGRELPFRTRHHWCCQDGRRQGRQGRQRGERSERNEGRERRESGKF